MSRAPEARSAEWHDERRQGIGASDIPSIAGLGWQRPIDVWEAKRGLVEPAPDDSMTQWGRILEAPIAEEAERATGRKFRRLARAVRYRPWPVLFAHLDRTSADAVLEVKTSMTTRGWGETGSSVVPDRVALQVQGQLACADKETAIVAALIGYRDFRWFEVPRDQGLFDDHILPLLREFWTLVETDTPPEPDGTEAYGRALRRRYSTDDGTERVATPEETILASELTAVRATKLAAEIREEELLQRLMSSMAGSSRLDGPGWHATWKQSRTWTKVDWKSLATGLLKQQSAATQEVLMSLHSEQREGARPFLFKLHGEDE